MSISAMGSSPLGDISALRRSFGKVLRDRIVSDSVKGIPYGTVTRFATIPNQGWNLLHGDLPLPCAVLRAAPLLHNVQWMQAFVAERGAVIAPHAKTTMSPQLIQLQMDGGAWGMTVATIHQLHTCLRVGVRRIILANQVAADAERNALFAALVEYPGLELYCLADSLPIVEALEAAGERARAPQRLLVLVEVGTQGGRTGCRSAACALEVARAIHHSSSLALAGVEGFEGLLMFAAYGELSADGSGGRLPQFLGSVADTFRACAAEQLFDVPDPILTAGGSAFYDLVADSFGATGARVVTRSGCYISHDNGLYEQAQARLAKRVGTLGDGPLLEPALEVWAAVQSMPEPGLAILTVGRRDVGADAGWPRPLQWSPPGSDAVGPLRSDHTITGLNDQHGYMKVPLDSPLNIGSRVALGVSHPCTTFDKWQVIYVVDDRYNVIDAVETCF